MILIDYSAISIASVFAQKQIDEGLLRHQILNSLRMYNLKYRKEFGRPVICCDGGSWRKEVFAEYKAKRSSDRDKSDLDWDMIWNVINSVREDLKRVFPYPVVGIKGAEADDVIATLVKNTQEFGQYEPVMIISADKDYLQLQKYKNVSQFSTVTKKLMKEADPVKYLREHVIRGCGGDGVPNVLSDNDTLINSEKRQSAISAKRMKTFLESYDKFEMTFDDEIASNFRRNQTCIDFDFIPADITEKILHEYENSLSDCIRENRNSKILDYLISKRCRNLIDCIDDFFVK